MNMLAGLVLKIRKPASPPIITELRRLTLRVSEIIAPVSPSIYSLLATIDVTHIKPNKYTILVDDNNPSIPSSRFALLVVAINTITTSGMTQKPISIVLLVKGTNRLDPI